MNRLIRLVILLAVASLVGFRTSKAFSSPHQDLIAAAEDAIPFDVFASFNRIQEGNPIFACKPPEWAAASHAIIIDETVHYLWARRNKENYWVIMHSTAPISDPARVKHDPRNPVLLPSKDGFDNFAVEYPFPFWNPADQKFYVYYLGRQKGPPKQTGLLVGDGDFGKWTRVC